MHNGYISDFAKVKRKMCESMTQEAYEHIQGGTDTEHFAALLLSFLCPVADSTISNPHPGKETDPSIPTAWEAHHTPTQFLTALRKTISAIISIQKTLLGCAAQPNDLNIALTDGVSLVACRFRNHINEQPPSLYYSTTAGVTLNRRFPDHPDGAKGPEGSGQGKGPNGKKAAKGAEGHNSRASKDAGEHGRHIIVASEPTTYKDAEWTLVEKNTVLLVNGEGLKGIEQLDGL
jgi:glutamine amidotransferase